MSGIACNMLKCSPGSFKFYACFSFRCDVLYGYLILFFLLFLSLADEIKLLIKDRFYWFSRSEECRWKCQTTSRKISLLSRNRTTE